VGTDISPAMLDVAVEREVREACRQCCVCVCVCVCVLGACVCFVCRHLCCEMCVVSEMMHVCNGARVCLCVHVVEWRQF